MPFNLGKPRLVRHYPVYMQIGIPSWDNFGIEIEWHKQKKIEAHPMPLFAH
jgi:hypothetical protein